MGKQILREAEGSLQQVMSEATLDRDYESLHCLTQWASRIAVLLDVSGNGETPRRKTGQVVQTKAKRKRKSSRKKGYPRFVRDGDNLVKIGWSKKDRCEYEHKAQHEIVRAVAATIGRTGTGGKLFTMEDVLPVEGIDSGQVPDYQTYLVLAWLKAAELVEQHGRLGYSTCEGSELTDDVENYWEELASRTQARSRRKSRAR